MTESCRLLAALWGLAAVALAGQGKPGGPPPLVVDKKAPLLLDEPTEPDGPSRAKPGQAVADNGACFVCHANFKTELLAVWHAAKTIGCAACHGKSLAHCNDENNVTPPDVLYPAPAIGPSCRKCHPTHDVSPAKVIARWQTRARAATAPKALLCTHCHGAHRLRVRTVRWNKSTRKLIPPTGHDPRR